MAEQETVKIRVTIEINADEVVDTGLSVAQWNRMTDRGRQKFAQDSWDAVAQADQGGMSVVTRGAKEV